MVVGGGQQGTLNPGFVLLGTRQQGVPLILRELVLPGGLDSGFRAKDMRIKIGAYIASDHHLVVAETRLKLKKQWTTGQASVKRFNTAFFRHTNKHKEFKITLNNTLKTLQDLLEETELRLRTNGKGLKKH
ncbi:unnamed protein product [Schistosoma margrebowiei]|uniref:Uncharacterized protein n=1 Tax=Schistosoma margrebowiei TaxID=48269 RepID=A0A183LWI4_9TREM|nr:unnamed protein product [Schistosoma margrebowiei]